MAPSEKQPFYDPVPPTYDEALATGSRRYDDWPPPRSSVDDGEHDANETEAQSLLSRQNNGGPSDSSSSNNNARRRPDGYRPPTVESDNSDVESLLESDADGDNVDDDEAAHVRREMQEMDIEEPSDSRANLWRKRIAFALPRWRWSWRPTLPTMPRVRIRLPSSPPAEGENNDADANNNSSTAGTDSESQQQQQARPVWQWNVPRVDGMLAVIVFARVLAVFILVGFVYLVFSTDFFNSFGGPLGGGYRFNPEDLRIHIMNMVDPDQMRDTVQHFSSYAHIAGTEGDYATAMDMEAMLGRMGLDEIRLDKYVAYINYPKKDGRAVQIMDPKHQDKAVWSAKLEEEEHGEETAGHQTYAFHGHSKAGDVRGPLIYANYGSRDDFKRLADRGIKTEGAIALVRYYGTQRDRALKVKAAELAGFAGCIIYSDPADDGFLKGPVWPKGPYMPEDGVQRGSVSLTSWVVGDVLTPGWPSDEGMPRMKVQDAPGLVGIPSLPLAWRDAKVLLQKIKGHGGKVPDGWKGGVPDVDEWWTGDDKSPIVRLKNEQDENTKQPIWNVYGRIAGMEQTAKSIIIGNHRDSWGFGATDPHSGTAVLVEMARIFGDLVLRGWRPLRTIEFMSWDAEEYNMIGSTEYVENHLDELRQDAYAYINLDTAVSGTEFHASGSPALRKTLYHALGRVEDPFLNATLRELWDKRGSVYDGPGSESDYVAFQDISGTSTIDVEFRGSAVPHHSSYDDFELVDNVIDPGFVYHSRMAQVVGLMVLDLADRAIVPMDIEAYADSLGGWVADLDDWIKEKTSAKHSHSRSRDAAAAAAAVDDASSGSDKAGKVDLDLKELRDAAARVKQSAFNFSRWEEVWDNAVIANGGWEGGDFSDMRFRFNDILGNFDTELLDLEQGGGIPNRTQFKHIVFGPQLWSDDRKSYFPAIRDLVEAQEWDEARRFITKTAAILNHAAGTLSMDPDDDVDPGENPN
ncbi:Transferrin receptor-like dimerization domain [Geosmithia morbida]|uniref:Transferrin receptor-like dimerization domain n=1 Tax=Geosmithia morbida TaxID=1094350 RepID=A0A9P5D041_9HYPO|nr:Transferrin receptor-like dimerization domain [Geosmithia morbida]KAF4122328.1 Transferrin receptor-like dimerization domain [Geosmithia morbida]